MRIHMDTTPNAEGYFKSRVSEVQLRPIVNGPVVPNTLQSFLSPDGGSSSRLCQLKCSIKLINMQTDIQSCLRTKSAKLTVRRGEGAGKHYAGKPFCESLKESSTKVFKNDNLTYDCPFVQLLLVPGMGGGGGSRCKSAIIPTPFTRFGCKSPQSKAESHVHYLISHRHIQYTSRHPCFKWLVPTIP